MQEHIYKKSAEALLLLKIRQFFHIYMILLKF